MNNTNQDDLSKRFWLKSYDPGVPATIDPDACPSLVAMIETCFEKYAPKSAFSNMGVTLTFGEIDELTKRFAGFLQKTCQLKAGDRMVIMLPNVLQYPIAMFGAMRSGIVVVNINPFYTPRELSHVLQDSGAKAIVVLENFAHVVEKSILGTMLRHIIVTGIGDMLGLIKGTAVNFAVKYIKKIIPKWHFSNAYTFKEAINTNKSFFQEINITDQDIAYLQYTGGTTGISKGAVLTHRNMVANLMQAKAWIHPLLNELKAGIITALPLYHIFSLMANGLTFFSIGLTNILITNPRDIPTFVKELKRQPFSVMTGVNTLFNALLRNEDFRRLDFSSFIFTLGGGMAVQRKVAEEWQKVTHVPLVQAYGLTETSPAVTINPVSQKAFNGSIGLPISSTEVKICDDDGYELPLGEAGELMVRGPQVMQGYWEHSEETQQAITSEGWLHTGDIATMDAKGFLYIVDRKKDLIIVSGFNVYPNEIEDVIAKMKEVREVAVIGVPSVEHGEVIKAFIVPATPTLIKEVVIAHCYKELTHYKVPKLIEFRKELPKSNVGKVLRRVLRDEELKKNDPGA